MNTNTLFAALVSSPEGGGEVVIGDGSRYPYQSTLEALLGQVEAYQHFFHIPEQEEVSSIVSTVSAVSRAGYPTAVFTYYLH